MLDGTISTKDLGYEDQGWETHPLSEVVVIDGIAYRHHHTAGIMDKPISGVSHARSLLNKGHMSATVGHSHLYDTAEDMRFDGRRILALVTGLVAHKSAGGQASLSNVTSMTESMTTNKLASTPSERNTPND